MRVKLGKSRWDQRRDSFQDSKQALMQKLERLGISADEEALYGEEDSSPGHFLETQREQQLRNDLQAFETYERLWHLVLGVNSIDVAIGTTRITSSCQGVDFMDFFPEPTSILTVKEKLVRGLQTLRAELNRQATLI